MKIFYGAIINGFYLSGVENGIAQFSENLDDFIYSDNKAGVVNAIKTLKMRFPDRDIKLGTITVETSDVE
ncbi:MAG: hypothetical protein ACRCWQ_07520 [Bacilli bacterium]